MQFTSKESGTLPAVVPSGNGRDSMKVKRADVNIESSELDGDRLCVVRGLPKQHCVDCRQKPCKMRRRKLLTFSDGNSAWGDGTVENDVASSP